MGSAKVNVQLNGRRREESRYFLILFELKHEILGVDILPPSVRGFYLIFYC